MDPSHPYQRFALPGESIAIGVHCFIDTLTAHRLNSGKEGLEDLLVIRVGGIDHYVAIAGHYNRSSRNVFARVSGDAFTSVQTLLPPARMQVEANKASGTDGGNNYDGTRDVDGGIDVICFTDFIIDIHGNKSQE